MCDYSLEHVASRPAKVGDKLVTTRFGNSITRGFCAVGAPNVAVCLMPGTELAFEKEVEWEEGLGRAHASAPIRSSGQTLARFREVNADQTHMHHDALEFPDGQVVLLTRLTDGQKASVLQLPADERARQAPREVASEPVAARPVALPLG